MVGAGLEVAGTGVKSTRGVARALAGLAVAGAALITAGCSSGGSSSGPAYPAVLEMPAARTETTMTPAELKQATDNLVYEREHLNIEAQSVANPQPVTATNAPTTTGSVPQKKSAASVQPATQPPDSGVNAYAK